MIDDQLLLIARSNLVPMAERSVRTSPMETTLKRLQLALSSQRMFPPAQRRSNPMSDPTDLFGDDVPGLGEIIEEPPESPFDFPLSRVEASRPSYTPDVSYTPDEVLSSDRERTLAHQASAEMGGNQTVSGSRVDELPQISGYRPLTEQRFNQLTGDNGLDPAMKDQLLAMEALGYPLYEDEASGAVTFYDPYLREMRTWIDVASNYVGLPSDTAGGLEGMYQVADPDQMYKHEMLQELVENGTITEESAAELLGSFRLGERPFRGPTYKEGEVRQYFNSLGSEQLKDLQGLLVRAGLAEEEDLVMGVRDPTTRSLVLQVGDIASENGITINEYLFDLAKAGGVGGADAGRRGIQIEPWRKPIYMDPDPAALREAVRRSFSQILMRDVQDYELKLFADSLNDDYYQKYLAEVEQSRSDYGNRLAALNSGAQYYEAGGTVEDVSPLDRMADTLRTKYEDEIEISGEVSDRAADTQLVFQALGIAEQSA